jgi:basic amino acid/polyamine antiporter, APA family
MLVELGPCFSHMSFLKHAIKEKVAGMPVPKKMGFWGVLALVIGSQIGSAIFLLPSTLAPFGAISLLAWALTGSGAICLALVFSHLCEYLPQTGGPHVYITHTFGREAGFYTAWSYWLISWISSVPLVTTILLAFAQLMGERTPIDYGLMAFLLISSLTFLNLRGVKIAGMGEIVLSSLKVLPLVIIPLCGIFFWNPEHFVPFNPTDQSVMQALKSAALLALWGFVGVETATTPAGNVENPKQNIPRGLVWGTSLVACLYFFNTLAMMGLIPPGELAQDAAPYVTATQILWGGQTSGLLATLTIIMCVGSLNAWILASGQIAKGAAEDALFPSFFKKTTPKGGPIWGIGLASLGTFCVFIFFQRGSLLEFARWVIELSSLLFLLIYAACVLAFLYLLSARKIAPSWTKALTGSFALLFCIWIVLETGHQLLYALIIPGSGVIARGIWKLWRRVA